MKFNQPLLVNRSSSGNTMKQQMKNFVQDQSINTSELMKSEIKVPYRKEWLKMNNPDSRNNQYLGYENKQVNMSLSKPDLTIKKQFIYDVNTGNQESQRRKSAFFFI